MQKDPATPGTAHLRLLSDALEELCSAKTEDDAVRTCAALAQKACQVNGISVVLVSGEQFHFAPGSNPDTLSHAIRSKAITRISGWVLEAAQTAVVPDVHRDERTRLHTNGSTFARSLVVVPVGTPVPFAAVTFAWSQEHWPSASQVLVLEVLARATGLTLKPRLDIVENAENTDPNSIGEWLGSAADAEGVRGPERRHWLAVAELQYRVRNVLGIVRSLVRRTSEADTSAGIYASHLEGRISALARTQGIVMRHLGTGVDLEELIDIEISACEASSQVKTAGPPVRLRPRAAETLGLALHELATNAQKYGALATPDGRITITWRREVDRDTPCVRLDWSEEGLPSTAVPATHRGFGRDLIERTVPYELRGATQLTFDPDGVRCTIDIPLTADMIVL